MVGGIIMHHQKTRGRRQRPSLRGLCHYGGNQEARERKEDGESRIGLESLLAGLVSCWTFYMIVEEVHYRDIATHPRL